ncbi:hypothetical protein ACJ72_05703 [Emergomyces africanus]|uniref:Uncharacterized protein n=1 Tax=Emergomyces africanus TaxID=1955775 RepID=A0A1B7NT52_9EURO|nr:hypothetical protein ACJ72_05703 [Emergomyces africanus]
MRTETQTRIWIPAPRGEVLETGPSAVDGRRRVGVRKTNLMGEGGFVGFDVYFALWPEEEDGPGAAGKGSESGRLQIEQVSGWTGDIDLSFESARLSSGLLSVCGAEVRTMDRRGGYCFARRDERDSLPFDARAEDSLVLEREKYSSSSDTITTPIPSQTWANSTFRWPAKHSSGSGSGNTPTAHHPME